MSFVKSLAKLRSKPAEGPVEFLLVGLGNPGAQYSKTRHNIGFMALNRLAHRAHVRFRSSGKDRADVAAAAMADMSVMLAQPQTFMNDSGVSVARLTKRLNLDSGKVLLIYDDVDLPFGAIRVRQEGSAGGHRGVQSVIDHLRTTEIARIRIGIGRGPGGTKDHVLAEFTPEERQIVPELCDRVAEIVDVVLTEGTVAAMNRFNGSGS